MSQPMEFNTAVREVSEDDDGAHFLVDGKEMIAYPPADGQIALLMGDMAGYQTTATKVGGIINFFAGCLDEESTHHLQRRLLDPRDAFGLEEVTAILEWLIEEWTGRPTKLPSGSMRLQKSGGRKSTVSSRSRVATAPSD